MCKKCDARTKLLFCLKNRRRPYCLSSLARIWSLDGWLRWTWCVSELVIRVSLRQPNVHEPIQLLTWGLSLGSCSCYFKHGPVETQTMQTADCRLCRPCRLCRLSVIFLLVPQFSSKSFTIVSCFLSLCALCITIICCTDVYLQGWWVGNEKITGSCLPADVKAVSRAFSCAAFTQERARWRKVSCFFL